MRLVTDVILATRLDGFLTARGVGPWGAMVGVSAGVQVMDIAHGPSVTVERALDLHSTGSVAQMDIGKYYDSIAPMRVARPLIREGCDIGTVVAAFRHQILPEVRLGLADRVIGSLVARTSGTVTGSRVAGALGRVITADLLRAHAGLRRPLGFPLGAGRSLTMATYADSLYAVSSREVGCKHMLNDTADYLRRTWGLRIKEGSRQLLVIRGGPDDVETRGGVFPNSDGWKRSRVMQ